MPESGEGPTLLQLMMAAGTFVGAALLALVGTRKKQQSDGVEWFFDGPLVKALETLQGIYRETVRMREDNQRFATENNQKLDQQIELLREIKDLQSRRRS